MRILLLILPVVAVAADPATVLAPPPTIDQLLAPKAPAKTAPQDAGHAATVVTVRTPECPWCHLRGGQHEPRCRGRDEAKTPTAPTPAAKPAAEKP